VSCLGERWRVGLRFTPMLRFVMPGRPTMTTCSRSSMSRRAESGLASLDPVRTPRAREELT
jgi:hypothetical protein